MNNQYERIVSYIYRYDKGQKGMNVGFARVERRGQRSRITIQLRASLAQKIHEGYLFWQQPEGIRTIPMGRLALRGGNFVLKADSDTERLFGTELGLGQMEGIFIDVEKDVYYATTWKNDSFQLGDWREWQDGVTGVSAAGTEDKVAEQEKDASAAGIGQEQRQEVAEREQREGINGIAAGHQGTVESRGIAGEADVKEQKPADNVEVEERQMAASMDKEERQPAPGTNVESQPVAGNVSRGQQQVVGMGAGRQQAVAGMGIGRQQSVTGMGVGRQQAMAGMGMGRQQSVASMGLGRQQSVAGMGLGRQQSVAGMGAERQQPVDGMAGRRQQAMAGMGAGRQQSMAGMSAGRQQPMTNMAVDGQKAADSMVTGGQQPVAGMDVANEKTGKDVQETRESASGGVLSGSEMGDTGSVEKNSFSSENGAQAGGETDEKTKEQSQTDMQIQSICNACPFKRKNYDYGKKILMTFPSMKPFSAGIAKACVRMELQDIGCLPVASWQLAGNRFLLHGYYCYRHLLFAQLQNGSYVLGVPGVFNDKERRNAARFGFDTFQAIGEPVATQGVFGYWLMDMQPAA